MQTRTRVTPVVPGVGPLMFELPPRHSFSFARGRYVSQKFFFVDSSAPTEGRYTSEMRTITVGVVLSLSVALRAGTQETASPHRMPIIPAAMLTRPIDLTAGIGQSHDAVAGIAPQAQAYYDQGLSYLHDYIWIEAARSFNQALRLEPRLALA